MTTSPRLSLLTGLLRPQPRELTVSEIHHLICTHASPTSVLRYQEAVGRYVAAEAAAHTMLRARGYSRAAPTVVTVDNITQALTDLAGSLLGSTFPHQIIDLRQERM